MPTLSLIRVAGDTNTVGRLSLIKVSGDTVANVPLRLSLIKVSGDTVLKLTVAPIAGPAASEPGTVVTLTASAIGGVTPDSWSWSQASGPTTSFTPSGASVDVIVPSLMPAAAPGITVMQVTATKGGVTSAPATVSITALPQTRWSWNGTTWVGASTFP